MGFNSDVADIVFNSITDGEPVWIFENWCDVVVKKFRIIRLGMPLDDDSWKTQQLFDLEVGHNIQLEHNLGFLACWVKWEEGCRTSFA